MAPHELISEHWYWIRREDGSLAPYRFHRLRHDHKRNLLVGDFYVGSFLQSFLPRQVVGEAMMPASDATGKLPSES